MVMFWGSQKMRWVISEFVGCCGDTGTGMTICKFIEGEFVQW